MRLETFADLAAEPPRPDFLVDGVWPLGFMGVVYGASGTGKTFIMLDMLHAIATGRPWLGRSTRKGRGLYVAAEGAPGFPGRVQAWHRARGEPSMDGMRYLREPFAIHDAAACANLCTRLREIDFGDLSMLIIDTATANGPSGFDDNKSEHWKIMFDGAQILTRSLGCAVAFMHHPGHSGERPRGSYDQIGRNDIIMRVEKVGEYAGRFKLEKHRDFAWDGWVDFTLRKIRAEGSDETLSLIPEAATHRDGPTEAELSALRALARATEPLKAKAWETACGLPHTSFYRVRLTLLSGDRGYVGTKGSTYFITDAGRAAILGQYQVPTSTSESHGTSGRSSTTPPLSIRQGGGTYLEPVPALLNGHGELDEAELTRIGLAEGL